MHEECEIFQEQADHHFRTEIPHIIDNLRLKPNEFRLYHCLKKTAGDCGSCYKTVATICEECVFSESTFKKSLKILENIRLENGQKIIEVTRRRKPDGSPAPHLIKIVDIWRFNGETMRAMLKSKKDYKDNMGGSPKTPPLGRQKPQGGSPKTYKEEHIKEPPPPTPKKEKNSSEKGDFSNEQKQQIAKILECLENHPFVSSGITKPFVLKIIKKYSIPIVGKALKKIRDKKSLSGLDNIEAFLHNICKEVAEYEEFMNNGVTHENTYTRG